MSVVVSMYSISVSGETHMRGKIYVALVDAVTFVAAYVVEDVNLTICLIVDKWICALVLVEVLDDRHIGLVIRKNHVHVETP